MLQRSRRRSGLALVLGLALGVLGASVNAGEIIEQIVVKVNGEILTKTELETREVAALRQQGKQNLGDEDLKKAVAALTPQILVDTVDEMLILQRGRDLGYKLGDEQFKEILDRIKKDNKIETEEQFQAALKQENLTLADLRKSLERQMIVSRVQQNEVLGKIAVTEAEARAYYEAHTNEFTTPSSMMIREVLVAVPVDQKGLNVGVDEEAKTKAEALRARAAGGESMEKIAGDPANDAASKSNGGLIGPIKVEELDPGLRKIFEPLKPGGLTPVVRTSKGYQFFQVVSKSETQVLAFDQAREQIANRVAQTKQRGEFQKFLVKLRGEALIEWKNAELKKLYDDKIARDLADAQKG